MNGSDGMEKGRECGPSFGFPQFASTGGSRHKRCKPLCAAGQLTIVAWNVEWLFDGIDDPLPVPPRAVAKVARKLAALARVLNELDADIVHLAEVENCGILESLAGSLNGSYKPLMISGTDSHLRQQVALLSRISPVSALTRSDERVELTTGSTGVSKHLIADFSIGDRKLRVIGLHLKAHPYNEHSCIQREGQARIVQKLIQEALSHGKDVIVLGDFNDFDPQVPGPRNERPRSSVLQMLTDINGDGEQDMWNVLSLVPRSERYTSWHDKDKDGRFQFATERSLIDHVLVSESLRGAVQAVGIHHQHDPTEVSDHWPIWLQLNLHAEPSGTVVRSKASSFHWLFIGLALLAVAFASCAANHLLFRKQKAPIAY